MLPTHNQCRSPAFDGAAYRQLFQRNKREDFWGELDAMIAASLLHGADDGGRYRLSEPGMFFADTVAGLLAWMRVNELSAQSHTGEVWKKSSAMERMG